LNLLEYLYSDGVSLIEWSERLPADELEDYLEVSLAHRDKSKRQLTFTPRGERYEEILQQLKARE